MTLPVAVYGFVFFPDTPETTKVTHLPARTAELLIDIVHTGVLPIGRREKTRGAAPSQENGY